MKEKDKVLFKKTPNGSGPLFKGVVEFVEEFNLIVVDEAGQRWSISPNNPKPDFTCAH